MKTSTDRINLFRFITNPPLFFSLLSATLLTLCVAVAFLKPCSITPYFPYVAIGSALFTVRFKTVGISVAYGALAFYLIYFYPTIDPQMRLWEMGLIFVTALTTFIFLLCFEEVQAHSTTLLKNLDEKEKQLAQGSEQIKEIEQTYKEQCAELEKELTRLKEEAKARLLERTQDKRNLELLTSEIELLTNQKEQILASARTSHPSAIPVEVPELKRNLTKVEGLYKQLRSQFEEKTKILLATRKELFRVEGELEAKQLDETLQGLDREENLEKDLNQLAEENHILEEEIEALEEIVSHLLKMNHDTI